MLTVDVCLLCGPTRMHGNLPHSSRSVVDKVPSFAILQYAYFSFVFLCIIDEYHACYHSVVGFLSSNFPSFRSAIGKRSAVPLTPQHRGKGVVRRGSDMNVGFSPEYM